MKKGSCSKILGVGSATLLMLAAAPALAADGAELYAKNCAKCHGPDGKSDTPVGKAMKAPVISGNAAAATVEAVKTNAKHESLAGSLGPEELQAIADFVASL